MKKIKTEQPLIFGRSMPFTYSEMDKILSIVKKSFSKIFEEASGSEDDKNANELLSGLN